MGKGDKRSKRGKISIGTYGVSRPKNRKTAAAKKAASGAKTAKKKPAAKK